MLKWLATLFVVLLILAIATHWLGRVPIGRLPGDLRIPVRGRVLYVPFTSTVLLSLLLLGLSRIL